jgi:hypothetical protein
MTGPSRDKDRAALTLLLTPKIWVRFRSKVGGPEEGGCRLWQAPPTTGGYGHFHLIRVGRASAGISAHRAALLLGVGLPPADGLEAAHSCRNRNCVAVAHLRWATVAQNAADRQIDGTQSHAIGRINGKTVLTPQQVREIRVTYRAGGVSQRALSRKYGVVQSAICNIINGKRWQWTSNQMLVQAESQHLAAREIGSRDPE